MWTGGIQLRSSGLGEKTPLLADPSPWLCLLLFKPRKSCWLWYIHGALHKTLFGLTADPMWYTEHLAAGVEFSAVSLCFVHRRKCEFYLTAQEWYIPFLVHGTHQSGCGLISDFFFFFKSCVCLKIRNEFNLLLMNIELWGTSGIPKFYFEVLLTWSSPSLLCVWIQAANPENLGLLLFIFALRSLFSRSQWHYLLFLAHLRVRLYIICILLKIKSVFTFCLGEKGCLKTWGPAIVFLLSIALGILIFFQLWCICAYICGSGRKVCCFIVVIICTSYYLTPASTYIVCCFLYFIFL